MNREDIISTISIDFGLSKEQSEKTVKAIFACVLQVLKKDKNIEIQKFGKFKIISGKEEAETDKIRFTPSKKLALRVNTDFSNLKKIKVKKDLKAEKSLLKKFEGNLFLKENFPGEKSNLIISKTELTSSQGQKILISDDLIKLHKEITKDTTKNTGKDNLWG